MIEPKIASVYAEALFELAKDSDCLEEVGLDFISIADVFRENLDFLNLLALHTLDFNEKLDIIKKVFGEDESILLNFICLITEKDRINYIFEIENNFKDLYNKFNNILEVTVTTTIPLIEEERNKLIVKLQNKMGKRIKLIERIDSSIIGGVKLSYGDTLVDNSVSSRLANLSKELKNNYI